MNKQDFPLLKANPELVYLDNAATTQKPDQVIQRLVEFYTTSNANVHRGIYKLSETATEQYENARKTVAEFIGAEADEIMFTSGTTMGLNLLATYYFDSIIRAGDSILVSEMEHHSNLLPWQQLALKKGAKLLYIPLNTDLTLKLEEFEKLIQTPNLKLLALSQMSNVSGVINPITELIQKFRIAQPAGKVVIDSAQSLAHLKISVVELDCDFLAASGHKAFGPTGTGFLYGKKALLQSGAPFFTGGGMINSVARETTTWAELPEKYEAGTPNIAGGIAFATALEYLQTIGLEQIRHHEQSLALELMNCLSTLPEVTIYGPTNTDQKGPVFSFNVKGIHAHDLAQLLDQENIAVRAGHHCAQILHREVLQIPASVRASLAFYNDSEDVAKLCTALKKVIATGLH